MYNTFDSENMRKKVAALVVFQFPTGRLKEAAPSNMLAKLSTRETSHIERSLLKARASLNMLDMDLALLVFQDEKS